MEVLIELDMEFDWQNFIWVKGVVVTEPLQNFTGLPAGPLHQRVEYFEVGRTSAFDKVVDEGCGFREFQFLALPVPTRQSVGTERAFERTGFHMPMSPWRD